jgi:hypothetical protein
LHDEASIQRKEEHDDESQRIQPKFNFIQRQHEEENVQAKDIHLSRKDRGPPAVSPRFEHSLHSNTGSGRQMDGGTRQFMENRFSADFSGVKVHTDSHAVQMSSGINAQAFTHGQNIYFNSGKYSPDTGAGKHLLAHELTHTIQQGAAKSVQPFLQTKKLARSAGPSAFTSVAKKENTCGGHSCDGAPDHESESHVQRKENNTATPVRPELKRAVTYATSQIGKVDAGKKNEDGTRKGWERLKEYYQTALGEDKVVPDGGVQIPNSILEKNIKYSSTIKAPQPNKPITDEWKNRDAMPSWCGIFVWWSLIKGGVPMDKWKLGEGVKMKAVYPPSHIPKAGDIAYFNTNSHYAIVEKTEPENPSASDKKNIKVSTVNGNTAGEDNLGGQVQIKQHPISHWAGFFNPLFGLKDKMPKDPAEVSEAELQKILADAGVSGAAVNGGSVAPSAPAEIKPYTPTVSAPPATSVVVPPTDKNDPATAEGGLETPAEAVPELAPVEAPSPQTKEDDPAYQKIVKGAGGVKGKQKTHDTPESKAAAAQMASAPEEKLDKDSQAQMHQVGAMNVQEAKPFNAAAFKQQLMDRIKGALPKDDDAAKDRFYDSPSKGRQDMADAAGNMKGDVAAEKQKAGNAIAATANAPPDTSVAAAKPVVAMQNEDAGPKPYVPNGQGAAPKPKTDAEISLEKDSAQIDQTMAASNVTETQLGKSNEPEFNKALDSKHSSQQQAAATPGEYRQKEEPTLTKAEQQAKGQVDGKVSGMHDARADLFGKVDASKGGTKGKDEAKRKEISENLQRIYTDTKTKVDNTLNTLETNVTKEFEEAVKVANKVFEDKVREKLDDHYGIINTITEFVTGEMSPEVAKIFKDEKERFVASMDTVINSIAAQVEIGLNGAMQAIKDGKAEIDKYWNSLGPDLQKIGEDAKTEVLGKFTELEQSVKDKHDQLIEKLGDSYVKNLTALNETFDKLKTEAKGLLGAALDAIAEVIRAILRMKDMLLDTLRKAAHVIGDIIADPIGFLSNLITAVKMGINNFVDNIWTHLKKGFFEWLMGAMPPGIQFPEKWDGAGIFHFVLQILGLTYINIRGRTVKKLNDTFGGKAGEQIVAVLEEAFEIFQIIRKEGLPGLWKYIMQKVGDLKVMVIDAIQNFLIEKIVKAGITWIIGLLNPAGAFIKACKLIYDVIMFFVNNGKRILELINAVLDSIANIVAGNLTGAAKMVEKIIHAIQKPINAAIDWVIDKAIALARKLGIDKLVKKVKGGIDKGKDWAKKKVDQAKQAGKKVISKIKSWLGLEKKFKGEDGESHRLYFTGSETSATLTVASNPTPFYSFLESVEVGKDGKKKTAKGQALPIAKELDGMKGLTVKGKDDEDTEKKKAEKAKAIQGKLDALSKPTAILFGNGLPANGKPKWSPDADSKTAFGGSMTAKMITKNGMEYGSPPTGASHTIYDVIDKRRQPGGASYYIRGHLLNDNLGGPGTWKNLTPLSREGNHQHESQVESTLKAAVQSGGIIEYNVTVQYAPRGDAAGLIAAIKASNDPDWELKTKIVQAEDAVPRSLHCEAYLLKNEAPDYPRQQALFNASVINTIERTPESYALSGTAAFEPVKLNSMSVDELMRLSKVDAGFTLAQAQDLADLRRKRGKDFGTYDVLGREMIAAKIVASDAGINNWREKKYVTL